MHTKKIRGHKRIHRTIERFKHAILDIDIYTYIKKNNRIFITLDIHPWNSLSVTNSIVPQPKGKTKLYMLKALLDIYDYCHSQLQQLSEPYYCKLWLFERFFSHSQIVCATGIFIDYYETTFRKLVQKKHYPYDNFTLYNEQLKQFTWQIFINEIDIQMGSNDFNPMKKQFDIVWIGSKG